jgi:hypothetical protein
MTIQEAYHKGLDDAEAAVISKLTNALKNIDDGRFANPELEKLRQDILTKPPVVVEVEKGPPVIIQVDDREIFDVLELMLYTDDYNYVGSKEKTIILGFYGELMSYLRNRMSMKNKLCVQVKNMISKVNYQLTFERTKVN